MLSTLLITVLPVEMRTTLVAICVNRLCVYIHILMLIIAVVLWFLGCVRILVPVLELELPELSELLELLLANERLELSAS